jgi:hypothetical protein
MTSAAGGEKDAEARQPDEKGVSWAHITVLCVHVRVEHT